MPEEVRFAVEGTTTTVTGILLHPRKALALYVLAHGAGMGMRHPLLEAIAEGLAERGIGPLRYQFPYVEEGKRYPNPPTLLGATVRSALRFASEKTSSLPLFAGGQVPGGSNDVAGGRREAASRRLRVGLPGVSAPRPRHAGRRPGQPPCPGGTPHALPARNPRRLCATGPHRIRGGGPGPRGILHFVEGGDHSFNVLKRSDRHSADVLDELLEAIVTSGNRLVGSPP